MAAKLALVIAIVFSGSASAQICGGWSAPERIGALETSHISEASGLAVSKVFPGRLYHHNDSGDGPAFFITDSTGGQTQKVTFHDQAPTDLEDMSVGPCAEGSCLFLGDIGDNFRLRSELTLWILPELATYTEQRAAARRVQIKYPDGRHDAEALAVHPLTGDLFVLTKERDQANRRGLPAHFYRIAAQELRNYVAPAVLSMEKVSTIDLPWLNYDFGFLGHQATSMDIRPDGQTLLVLTYDNAVEISFAKALEGNSRKWAESKDYRVHRLYGVLSQMEAVAFAADGQSFLLESEFNPAYGDKDAPILRVGCRL